MTGAAALIVLLAAPAASLEVVTVDSSAPLVQVKVMVKAGSASDPPGLEGAAAMTAALMIEGGFGDPASPVTKERLAELTRPWGSGAYPRASVSKETTVFSFTVPREVLFEYVGKVLGPMLARPLFDAKELSRLREEQLQGLRSGLRLEAIENLGLVALDNAIHAGTSYAHPDGGTEKGLQALDQASVRFFYRAHYRPDALVLGVGASDPSVVRPIRIALEEMGRPAAAALPTRSSAAPGRPLGRRLLLIGLPNAISSGIHAGFPIAVTRRHADFWPLYVANVWFGAHRDGFSHLYQVLREERGYNYGDYSYIEHFEARPSHLFPPFNTPRRHQYFSVWLRPLGHAYVPHALKALTWELEDFIRTGLSEEACRLAKNKARVLYLSLAETGERMLASALDDSFYGMKPGYLPSYLASIEGVRCEEVNAAIRRHLQTADLQYLVVTHLGEAPKIAEAVAAGGPAWGKGPADYQIDVKEEDGKKLFLVPEPKLDILRRDAVWAHTPLGIGKDSIKTVPAEKMFETAELPR